MGEETVFVGDELLLVEVPFYRLESIVTLSTDGHSAFSDLIAGPRQPGITTGRNEADLAGLVHHDWGPSVPFSV